MRNIRVSILVIVVILICLGVVMVYSASAIFCYDKYHSPTYYLNRHLLRLLIGLVLAILVMSLDLYRIRKLAKPLFIFSFILLIALFLPHLSRQVGGARRWLNLGPLDFQPSEMAKWATVLFLADVLSNSRKKLTNLFSGLFCPLGALALSCLLILLQPDLGGALTLGAIGLLLFFVAGIRIVYIVSLFLLSLPVIYFAILKVPYQQRRIIAFLDPWADARGSGFQLVQSYLALGLGGLWGVGLGQSRQKLFYLPAAHTDFIFSIIGEELGLIGTLAVVLLFILLLWQGIRLSLRSTDSFIQLLSFGIVAAIVIPAFVHMAVVCGAIPTKGLPLPFISYGGSSLIFNIMGVGLLLNAARDRYLKEQKL